MPRTKNNPDPGQIIIFLSCLFSHSLNENGISLEMLINHFLTRVEMKLYAERCLMTGEAVLRPLRDANELLKVLTGGQSWPSCDHSWIDTFSFAHSPVIWRAHAPRGEYWWGTELRSVINGNSPMLIRYHWGTNTHS